MPVPVVAVQVDAPPPEPELLAQLLKACNTALGAGACIAVTEGMGRARHLAYVSWLDDAEQHALIEVGERDEPRGHFEFRRLRFTTQDLDADRWQAMGLTVATLVGPARAPAAVAPLPEPEPQPAPEPAAATWRIGLDARLASGFVGSGPSAGVGLGVAYQFARLPLYPLLRLAWSTASAAGVRGDFWNAGVGLGVGAVLGPVRMGVGGLVVSQVLRASATNDSGDSEAGYSVTPGLGAVAELGWPGQGPVGLTLGGEVSQWARPTEVSYQGSRAARSESVGWAVNLGIEARF